MDFESLITVLNGIIEQNIENLENILFRYLIDEGSGEAGELARVVAISVGCLAYINSQQNNNPNNSGMLSTQQMQNSMSGGINCQGDPGGQSGQQVGSNGQNNGQGGQGGPSGNHGTPPNFQNGGGNGGPSNHGGQR